MIQYTSDVPNYAGTFESFIITSPGYATFYSQPNYEGLSICLKPNDAAYPTHWTWDTSSMGWGPDDIKSMKFGCDSTNVHYSSPISLKD